MDKSGNLNLPTHLPRYPSTYPRRGEGGGTGGGGGEGGGGGGGIGGCNDTRLIHYRINYPLILPDLNFIKMLLKGALEWPRLCFPFTRALHHNCPRSWHTCNNNRPRSFLYVTYPPHQFWLMWSIYCKKELD